MQILNIVLWQKNGVLRNLELQPNAVNVITGDSGKGKSSILSIIDYCLLASEAKGISKANIDSKVDWYGIRFETSDGILTVARPSQSESDLTQAYFSADGEIPHKPDKNIRIENLKTVLNRAMGVDSELRIPYGGKYVKAGSRVSFRSFLPHAYQDQNTITAPEYLYIRPSDKKYQERIERTFRMAMGVESVRSSILKARLAELELRKSAIERKIQVRDKNSLAFDEEILSLQREAQSHGLLPATNNESSPDALISLRRIISQDSIPDEARAEIDNIESKIFSLKTKNRSYQAFLKRKSGINAEQKEVEDALRPVEIINQSSDQIFPSVLANSLLNRLNQELQEIRVKLKSKNSTPFLREVETLVQENLEHIRKLENAASTLKANLPIRSSVSEYYKYLGRLDAKIELYANSATSGEDFGESEVDRQIEVLQAELEQDNVILSLWDRKLDELINKRLSRLRLKGYDGFSATFDSKTRTIQLVSNDLTKIEKMPDIGSASNYLYLHLAYFFALHEVARRNNAPWMPSFLVLDQPSTPYFATTGETADDIRSLDAALAEMNQFIHEMVPLGGFQIVLLEHIEESHWTKLGLDRFRLVDRELRGDYGLIQD